MKTIHEKAYFKNHKIQLQKGDLCYIFSDGFADQFGHNDSRKFYISNLKKLLLKNADKPMHEQGELLKKAFKNWKNYYLAYEGYRIPNKNVNT